MKCTSCNSGELTPTFLEGAFRAHTCNSCGGNWILIEDYVSWKERNPNYQFSDNITFEESDTVDSRKALICPVSGAIMRKFNIASDIKHRIDYSERVCGVWLDKGEWELLKNEGVAGCLNAMLTNHWQTKIKQNNSAENFADIYKAKFGNEDYQKAKMFREWLDNHELKSDLRAYVLAESPYSTEK